MKLATYWEIDFPAWAICLHEYGYASDCTEEEEQQYSDWRASIDAHCKGKGYDSWNLDLNVYEEDEEGNEHPKKIEAPNCVGCFEQIEPSFSNNPEFGLPCDCYCSARVNFWKKDTVYHYSLLAFNVGTSKREFMCNFLISPNRDDKGAQTLAKDLIKTLFPNTGNYFLYVTVSTFYQDGKIKRLTEYKRMSDGSWLEVQS